MLKNSIFASAIVMVIVTSLSLPVDAAKPKKTKQQKLQEKAAAQESLQSQQGQYDSGGSVNSSGNYGGSSSNSASGSASNGNSRNSGSSDSISMFKAGNTSLPSGTYAMTNVSTGAAFVVIVDDTGDMRAQDARAMNLVDDSKTARNSSKNHSRRNNSGSSYGGAGSHSDYNDSQNGNSQYSDSNRYDSSNSDLSNGPPAMLPPQQTPASAVLPTPMKSGHPLLQGGSQSSAYPAAQPGGMLPNLFTQQNPLMQGQGQGLGPNGQMQGGMKGALQAELQRQLGKQLMKHAPNLERQVRKVINGVN